MKGMKEGIGMKRAFVTGGSGFVGRNLIVALRARRRPWPR